jgi:RNA polymerase sigma factor
MPVLDTGHVNSWLEQAQSNDQQARDNLLNHFRPMIRQEAQRICRRCLEWGRDDELSVALIAFNESINAYRDDQNTRFWSFARMVLKRRLIDYFRASSAKALTLGEDYLAHESFEEDWEQSEREEEVRLYRKLLGKFGITFIQVAEAQPRHKETRQRLHSVATALAGSNEMMDLLYISGKLPKKKLCVETGVTSRMLDRSRVYLIALALLMHSKEFPLLKEYISDINSKGEQRE